MLKNPTRRVASSLPGVVKHWRWTAVFVASVVLTRASIAPAAVPVTVYTMSPALLEERVSLERVLSEYPKYQRKWESAVPSVREPSMSPMSMNDSWRSTRSWRLGRIG